MIELASAIVLFLMVPEFQIDFTGVIYAQDYVFHFVDECEALVGVKPNCLGFAREHAYSDVWIVSKKSSSIWKVCNHEIFHITRREGFMEIDLRKFEDDHRIIGGNIEELPSDIRYEVCDELIMKLYK